MNDNKYFYGVLALAVVVGGVAWFSLTQNPNVPAVSQSVPANSQAAAALQPHTITWNGASFPSATVSLTLIRKTSSSPASYSVVRTLAAAATNNGVATWVPTTGELDGTTYIQIGCVSSTSACQASIIPVI